VTRRTSNSPLLLLVASLALIGVAAGVAVVTAWKSRANTRQLLGDYAAFAGWSYGQHLNEEFGTALWSTVGPIGHREPHHGPDVPAASKLPIYRENNLKECQCGPGPVPATYFRFRLGSDSLALVGDPLTEDIASTLVEAVTRAVRGGAVAGREGAMVDLTGTHQLAGFGPMATDWGDTLVYGFTLDSAELSSTFERVLQEAPLLPAAVTKGRPNTGLFALEVRDPFGKVYYRSSGWPADEREWPFIASDTLGARTADLITRLTLVPATASTLLAGGLPRAPLPLLLLVGLLGVVAAALATAQLRRQGELARLRSEFVAGVSHELRTPLAQLRLFLDTLRLKRYDTPEEQEWLVGHLTRETTRLEHLVENVLAASRLDRGMHPSVPLVPLDLGAEVKDAATAFAPLAASRRAILDTEVTEGIEVLADQATLRQLVLNLLDNAVKFGPAGQHVRLSVRRSNGTARLTVSDQGPGVPERERERIWEPYYRGTDEAARAVGGSGIGLSLVREIAGSFGGTATVAAAPGGGAEFSVTIPVANGDGP
jgi:signal transduction histidine kinase